MYSHFNPESVLRSPHGIVANMLEYENTNFLLVTMSGQLALISLSL